MSIDWDGYEIYGPGVAEPLGTLTRVEARRAYERCMQTKPARKDMLRRLLKASGVGLDTSDAAIQDLNDWFYMNIEPDEERPGELPAVWLSVVHDVALFLGDVMIERHPNLRWEFFVWGKRNVSYQRHVIMGFGTEDPKFKTNVDIDRDVTAYGYRIIAKRGSITNYGTETVRGVEIDVDAVTSALGTREVQADVFWSWLQVVGRRA